MIYASYDDVRRNRGYCYLHCVPTSIIFRENNLALPAPSL